MLEKGHKARNVVGMLVRHENAADFIGVFPDFIQSPLNSNAAETGIDKQFCAIV